jgi:hypothetical protein
MNSYGLKHEETRGESRLSVDEEARILRRPREGVCGEVLGTVYCAVRWNINSVFTHCPIEVSQ